MFKVSASILFLTFILCSTPWQLMLMPRCYLLYWSVGVPQGCVARVGCPSRKGQPVAGGCRHAKGGRRRRKSRWTREPSWARVA